MIIAYSVGFFIAGSLIELIFQLLEKIIIAIYSSKGKVRSKKLYQIPFEIVYWLKLPLVSAMLYYTMIHIPNTFNFFQIIFNFSLFALGMYLVNEYFKDLKY